MKSMKYQILRKPLNFAGNPLKSSQTKSMKISNFAKTSKFGCKSLEKSNQRKSMKISNFAKTSKFGWKSF